MELVYVVMQHNLKKLHFTFNLLLYFSGNICFVDFLQKKPLTLWPNNKILPRRCCSSTLLFLIISIRLFVLQIEHASHWLLGSRDMNRFVFNIFLRRAAENLFLVTKLTVQTSHRNMIFFSQGPLNMSYGP